MFLLAIPIIPRTKTTTTTTAAGGPSGQLITNGRLRHRMDHSEHVDFFLFFFRFIFIFIFIFIFFGLWT
jgi:hypothetical protein